MHFPRDIEEGNRFEARFREAILAQTEKLAKEDPAGKGLPISRAIGELLGSMLEPLGGFSVLQDAPIYPEMRERLYSRIWPGCVAGDILINLLQLRAAGLEASVNKAIAIELDFLSRATTRSGLSEGGRSSRYVRDAWQEFKPACHLWAAYRTWDSQGHPESFSPYSEESINAFLAISQRFGSLAASLQSRGRREPLLSLDEMWTMSRRYALPEVRLAISPLEDWKLEVLRRKFKSLRS